MLGIVAVVLAGYALWRQRRDRSVSVATFNLVKTGITSQQELRKQDKLEWKSLNDTVHLALIFFGIVILGIVLYALFVGLACKRTEGRTSSSSLVLQ
jgi:heme A synthase